MWMLIILIVNGPLVGLSSHVEFKSEVTCKAALNKLNPKINQSANIYCVQK